MVEQGTVTMIMRLGLQALAGALVARGIGDDGLWQVVIGAVMSAGGGLWSYAARRKLVQAAQ